MQINDIFRKFGPLYLDQTPVSSQVKRVIWSLARCCPQPLALGETAGAFKRAVAGACLLNCCPQCTAGSRAEWYASRIAEQLRCDYVLITCKLPPELRTLALLNKRVVLGALMEATATTVTAAAWSVGVDPGFLMVLHTWAEDLFFDPHVHVVMPLGGLAFPNKTEWRTLRLRFLDTNENRGRFALQLVTRLSRLHQERGLYLPIEHRLRPRFVDFLEECTAQNRAPDIQPRPYASAIGYVAKHYPRVPGRDENVRLLPDDQVQLILRDGSKTLAGTTFVSRYVLHVLPCHFRGIRHRGFLSNKRKARTVMLCRQLLGEPGPDMLYEELVAPAASR